MEEYRVFKKSYLNSNKELMDAELIGSFENQHEGLTLLRKLVNEDSDDFADENYYITLYELRDKNDQESEEWIYNEEFGHRHLNPKTAKSLFKKLE